LIRRIKRAVIARQKVQVFKPSLDDRYGMNRIASHSKNEIEATPIPAEDPELLLEALQPETKVVGLDEAQFFNWEVVDVCRAVAAKGIRVIVTGLDLDYAARPFGPMPQLLAVAEKVDKLTAICDICGAEATRTQRLTASTDQVEIGASEKYAARCSEHHSVPK
jgi:thymidine kinase